MRSGGHNWLGASLRDRGILVDLGEMVDVEVDAGRLQAKVGAGATHQMLADHLVRFGTAFPIGHCLSVGLGGYLLAGGMGWNLREWGPGCWNVRAADVVMADGEEVLIDESTDSDLLWALRGGSSGFPGLVTSFHLDLVPMPQIAIRHVTFDLSELPTLLHSVANELRHSEPGLEASLIVRPPTQEAHVMGKVIMAMTAFASTTRAAESRIEDLLTLVGSSRTRIDDSGIRLTALNELEGEGGWSDEFRYGVDTCWVKDRYELVGELIVENTVVSPSADSRVVLSFGFLPDREIDSAFTGLGELTVNVYATWYDIQDDQKNLRWLRAFMSVLSNHSSGRYVGEADTTEHPLTEAYPRAKLERLQHVMGKYDPGGVFSDFLSGPEGEPSIFQGDPS